MRIAGKDIEFKPLTVGLAFEINKAISKLDKDNDNYIMNIELTSMFLSIDTEFPNIEAFSKWYTGLPIEEGNKLRIAYSEITKKTGLPEGANKPLKKKELNLEKIMEQEIRRMMRGAGWRLKMTSYTIIAILISILYGIVSWVI